MEFQVLEQILYNMRILTLEAKKQMFLFYAGQEGCFRKFLSKL